jgi:hypothetical protein
MAGTLNLRGYDQREFSIRVYDVLETPVYSKVKSAAKRRVAVEDS